MNTPLSPEELVNSFFVGNQDQPAITTLADGSYVIVWVSDEQDGSGDGIIAQHYSAQGERIGSPVIVNTTALSTQRDPSVAATEDGGFVIVWEALNQDPVGSGDYGIFGQRFAADGSAVGGEFQVNAVNSAFTQFDPEVTGLPGGGFAVTYVDDLGDSNGDGIRIRFYDAAGVPTGNDVQVNTETSSNQNSPVIATIQPDAGANSLPAGGVVVVWSSPTSGSAGDGSAEGVFAQLYAPDGTAIGSEFQVNTSTAGNQTEPQVAGLDGGRFVVVWTDQNGADGSGHGVFAQVFEGDGTPVLGEFQVNVETSSTQFQPSITATTDGGFVIGWSSWTSGSAGDGNQYGVFARRFDEDGTALTGEIQLNQEISGNQQDSVLAALPNGNFVSAWRSETSGSAGDGDGNGIFQRLFGDPLSFTAPSASPEISGFATQRTFAEDVLNSGPQRLDAPLSAAFSDADSADFDGGRLILAEIAQSVSEDGFPDQDAGQQWQFGLDTTGVVSIAAGVVSVSGTAVGTVASDGTNGQALIIDLNASADAAAVEILIEHLTIANSSDDAREQTTLSLLVEDGDGATSDPVVIEVNVTPDMDIDGTIGNERQVNTFAPGNQHTSDIATLADGGYVSVWTSTNQDNPGDGDTGVFAQRFDANGLAVGGEFQVNTTVTSSQFNASVAGLNDGGWVIVWDDDTTNGIRLNRYDSTGALTVTELQVETQTSGNQDQPHVAALTNGGYVVTWTSDNSGSAGDGSSDGVFAQLYNAAGAAVGGEIALNQQTTGTQDNSQVAALSGGRFVVVWREADVANGDGSGSSVAARIFDASGIPEGNQIQVNSFTNSDQNSAVVAVLDNGDFVVAWRSNAQDGSSGGIYYQRFTDAGVAVGGEIRVNDSTSGDQTVPDLIALDGGGFVISWTDTSTPAPGSSADVFAQVFDADGTRLDSEVRINTEVAAVQDQVSMTALPDGNYVVQWTSQTSGSAGDGSGDGIFQQIIGDPSEISQSAAPVLQGLPLVVQLDEGDANTGTQLVLNGALSLSDADSADLAGGRVRLVRVVTDPVADGFNPPDSTGQDSVFIAVGGVITQAGSTLLVNGVAVATISSDGANGADLTLDLLAGATLANVETLLNALSYQTSSDNPRDSRTYSLTIEDGDGGLTQPRSLDIRITQEAEAGAPVPVGNEQQVNSFTPNNQGEQEVTALQDGGWVVVWMSDQQDTDSNGIFGQRYNSEGVAVGGEFQVSTFATGSQADPVVTALDNGGWVVVWESNFLDAPGVNDTGIIAQRYNADGTPAGGETVVNITTAATQFDPAVATIPTGTAGFPAGGYVVTYTADAGDASSDGIVMQRFATDGTPVGGEITVNTTISGNQGTSDVAVLNSGAIAVSYHSGGVLFVRVLNPDGTEAVAEYQVAASSASDGAIAATADGGFVIAWTDSSGLDGSGSGIVAQRFDATGAPAGNVFVVNEIFNFTQREPDVIGLDDGRFVISWREDFTNLDGSGDSVQAQIFSATGARLDGQFLVNRDTTLSTQFSPELAALPGGNFVATFSSVTSGADGDGSGNGVFQQVFGDPADFTPGVPPVIQGLSTQATFKENDVNAGLQRLDADATVAVGDTDAANFDGGVLTLEIVQIQPLLDQLNVVDGTAQDQLGLVAGDVGNGDVQFTGLGGGDTVSVNGTTVGTISVTGSSFTITFNSSSTVEDVEAVMGNLAYGNGSDAPLATRKLSVSLTDGDGHSAPTEFIDVTVTPETDVVLTASDERRVNAHTESTQNLPQVVELQGGNVVVVWQSYHQDNADFTNGTYAQVYNASGVPVGPEFLVNTTVAAVQQDPAIAATSDGGFVVVWEGQNQDNGADGDYGVIAQRFDATGTPVGGEVIVNTTVVSTQFDPAVAAFEDGGFIVTYTSDSGDGSIDAILSQRFDASGVAVGSETVVSVTTNEGNQSQPDVATLVDSGGNNAGHVIVFTAPTSGADGDGSGNGIYAQLYNAAGAAVGGEFLVNTTTANNQSDATVTGLAGGGFVVAWTDDSLDGSSNGVFAQIYDETGAMVGTEFRVNADRINSEADADVTALSDGGFLISWTASSSQDGSGDGVFAQRFDATGARVDNEFRVNQETSSTQYQSAVTSFGDGFAAVWTSVTSGTAGDGSDQGVFLRFYQSSLPANNSPVLEDFERNETFFADDLAGGSAILDTGVGLTDPDGGDFDGGTLLLYYTAGGTANDQLSVATDSVVTIVGSTISVNGTAVGTIDALQDGANGNRLLINFNSSADAASAKIIIEHLSFGSTDTAANLQNTTRGIGIVLTDGDGGQTEPDSIYLTINPGASAPTGILMDDFGQPESENGTRDDLPPRSETDLFNAPQLIDANVNLMDFAGTTFDGGFLQVQEVWNSGGAQQISVQNQGAGSGQIGFDGTNVSYEGTVIGTVDATLNGVNGQQLQIDLNASATAEGVEALAEAFTIGLTGNLTSPNTIGFYMTVQNGAGNSSFVQTQQDLIRDLAIVDPAASPEAQVNTFIQGSQNAPRVSELSDGGYIVTWISTSQDVAGSGNRGIFAQRYNEQGQQIGVEFQVNDIALGDQVQARVEGLSNGNYVILWTENSGRDGSGSGVFGQLFQNDGTRVGTAFQVNEQASSTQNQPEVVDLGAGRFMTVWSSQTSGGAGDGSSTGIFGRVFDASGAPEAGEFQINSTTSGTQNRPQMTTLPNGDVLVVWEDQGGADGSGFGVFAQRVNSSGALVSFDGTLGGADERQINTTTAGTQENPDVAVLAPSATLPGGGFVVVWQSPDASSSGIFAQIYDADGVAQGGEFQVNAISNSQQLDPVVHGTPGGGFTVAWADASGIDSSGWGILAREFNADGTPSGNSYIVNQETSSTQYQPDLAVLNNGATVHIWRSETSGTAGDGSGQGIFQSLTNLPVPAAGAGAPVLEGVEETVTFDENTVNAAPQLLNQDGAISLTDADSADLDGGSILVQRVVGSSLSVEELLGGSEGINQDVFGVANGNGISVAGNQISFNGNVIGTIVQDGSNGDPLEIALSSANATPEAVETILAQLSYQNVSDDPNANRTVAIQVTDGDGGSTGTQTVEIIVNSEADSTLLKQGDEEQVNTFTTNNQDGSATSAIYNSAGVQTGYVVVWRSWDQDRVQDGDWGIFGQMFDLNGVPVGGEFQVALHTEFSQSDPTVTGLHTGGFVVGWADNSWAHPDGIANGEVSHGTFAQIFDENGARVGDEFLVNDLTSSTQDQLEFTSKADGTIVAVYVDHAGTDGSGLGVFMREFDSTGTALGASVQVNEQTSSSQTDPAVAVLTGGRVVVTWTSANSAPAGDGNANGVFGRVFEADGTPVGGEFQINTSTLSNQDAARVTGLSDGTFVVVWDDDSGIDGSSTAIVQQRFDANGAKIGPEILVNEITSSTQNDPYVVALDTGGWVVAWSDASGADGSGWGVFGQQYAADGSRVDGLFQINTEFSSTQSQPRLVALPGGGFTAVWTSTTSASAGDGSLNGVFQQVFGPNGLIDISADPVMSGLVTTQNLDEAALNAGGHLIADVVGLGDADSADFDGGALTVTMIANDVIQPQFNGPDDGTQDQLGLDSSGTVAIAGSNVSVGGTVIGTLVSDGADGAPLEIRFNSSATQPLVETLVRSITYGNTSDDPVHARLVSIQVTDGDGGHVRETVQINIAPEQDGGEVVGDEVQTNSFTTGSQSDSHVATLADGGYVIVWTSNNQDATGDSTDGVFAQRYDASGAPIGGEFQVNSNAAGQQFNAQVVGLSTGGFVIAWEDQSGLIGSDGDEEIALQVYDSNGQPVGGEISAPSASHFDPDSPALAAFDNGDFLLVRHGRNPSNGSLDEIFVQRFNDAGGTVGSETAIATAGSTGDVNPDVAIQADGTYVVVYRATNVDNPGDFDTGIFMQRFAADNSLIGGPLQVNTVERFSQYEPRVAALEGGGYVVVYTSDFKDDFGYTPNLGVYAQIYDGAGNRVGDEFLVNEVVDNNQNQPDVVGLTGGGFAITYSDNNSTDGNGVGVFLQQYDASGHRIDGPVQINQETSSTQSQGAIASLGDGNVVVSWTSTTSGSAGDGSNNGVFHRFFGDPADFASGGDPVLEGINSSVTYDENTLNGVPQLIDANSAVAVSDPDSADFDGGSILVSNVVASAPLINQINSPDDLTQDQLGLRQTARITIAGSDVSVDGTVVGTIIQNGQDGTPFELRLNAFADAEVVELLVENLTYRNISNDPLPVRELRVQITDGDGGASIPQFVTVNITPSQDAGTPVGGEVVVNTATTSDADNPAIATIPGTDGDFIVVYESSTGPDGSGHGLYAQRFDSNGNKVTRDGTGLPSGSSDEFQINTTTTQDQFDASIAGFSNGGWVVTWTDDTLDGSGQGIVMQMFNADGTLNGGEVVVNTLTSSTQSDSEVTVLNDGTFVVTWESINSGGASDGNGSGILARHFAADGTPLTAQFVVNTESTSEQINPAITSLDDGGFLITWQSLSSGGTADGSAYGVFGQRYDAAAAPVGSEFQINTTTNDDQFDPDVAVLDNGNVIVTWVDDAADLSSDGIFATIIAPDGTPVTSEFRVNDQRIWLQVDPVVTALDTGGFVIAWTDHNATDGSGQGVYAQQYDSSGARVDSQFLVNTTTAGTQNQPAITSLPGGGFVITWNGSVMLQVFGNEAPSISPVSALGDEDTAIVLDETIFDAGFVDPDGNDLQEIRIETFPTNGTLALSGVPVLAGQVISRADLIAGNLVYTGNADYNGPDSFLWTGSDGTNFSNDPAVAANITVNPVNDAPGLEAGADSSVTEGQALNRTLVLTDPDTDLRSFTIDFGDGTAPVLFNSNSLTPNINHTYAGEGTFTVTVTVDDNAGEANSVEVDTFEVTVVNGDPDAVNDFDTVSEDGPAETGNVLTNDSDPGGDTINVVSVNGVPADVGQQVTLASGALFTLNADGSYSYDPNGQFESLADFQNGNDQVTYEISDGEGGTDTATLFITIDGQNDAPDAADDEVSVNDDSTVSGNVLDDNGNGADSDPDNLNTLSVSALNGQAGDIGSQITLASGALVTLNSDGTFDYDPNGAFTGGGSDSFQYTVSDGRGGTDIATVNITINATNQLPVAQDDGITANEDSVALGNVLADNGNGVDSDPDADPLTVTRIDGSVADIGNPVTLAGGGVVTLQSNGDLSFDPDGQYESLAVGQTATETFTYTVEDGQGGADMATVTITINGVNDGPDADNDSDTTDQDSTTSGNVLTNDMDVDTGDVLSVSEVGGSALAVGVPTATTGGGQITINSNGSYTYDPNGAYDHLAAGNSATDSIVYTVSDGNGGTDTATLFITVNGLNDGPTAQDDDVSVGEDNSLSGNVVLDNGNGPDSDPDTGDIPFVSEVNGSAAGIGTQITLASGALLTLNGSGTFTYDTNGQFESLNTGETATDSFTYTLQDAGGLTDTATVTVTIDGNADAPVAQDDDLTTDEDTAIAAGNVFADNGNGIDSDADGDAITVSHVNGEAGDVGVPVLLPSGASLTLNSDGTFSYDPNGAYDHLGQGQSDTDTFQYSVSDGNGGSDTATVSILINGVNDVPFAGNDFFATDEETPLNGLDLFANNGGGADSDPDAPDALTIVAVNGQASNVGTAINLAAGGTIMVAADGTASFDPDGDFEHLGASDDTTVNFTYTISDGNGGTDTATVFFDVNGVNDDPVAADDTLNVAVDAALSGNVLDDNGGGADSDIDATDVLTVTELNGSPAALGVPTTLASGAIVTLNADGTFAYDQNGSFSGLGSGATALDTFDYSISDGNGGSDTATVTITIGGSNLPPVAQDDDVSTNEDTAIISGDVFADNGNGADSDPNGDSLTVIAVDGVGSSVGSQIVLGSGALLTLNSDGTFDYDPNGVFETLAAGESDTDSFSYTVSDGNGGTDTATVTVTVDGVNDAPVAEDDDFSTDEDTAIIGGNVLADNGNGADSDVDASDVLSVSAVNGQGTAVGSQIVLASGALLTLNSNGTFDYDPNGAFEALATGESDTDSFSYTISDGNGGSDTATVTIDIDGVNDAPVAEDDDLTTDEDSAILGASVLADNGNGADSDVDTSDSLMVTAVNGSGASVGSQIVLASGALLTLGSDGMFDYDPNGAFETLAVGQNGTDSFNYTISDGNGGSDTATVTIDIAGVNDAPVAQDDSFLTDEDTAILGGDVLADNGNGADSDVDTGDVLTVTAVNGQGTAVGSQIALASGALLTLNSDGTFDYDPNGAFEALGVGEADTDSFTYTISDGNGGSDTATVTIDIDGVNDAPVFVDAGPFAIDENTTAVGTITADDVDANDTLTYSIIGGDDGALFDIDGSSGALSFKTAPDFEAPGDTGGDNTYEVQVQVSDGTTTVDTFVFVDVLDVNEGGGGPNVIQGTNAPFEQLNGTGGADEIRTGGGRFDYVFGGGGADTFVIEQQVDMRDLVKIFDYEAGVDSIDLLGRSVVSSLSTGNSLYLFLDGDFDTVIVSNVTSLADLTFV